MVMPELDQILSVGSGLPLLIAAIADLRRRAVPVALTLLIAIGCLVFFLLKLPSSGALSQGTLIFVVCIGIVGLGATFVRWIGVTDCIVLGSLTLLGLGLGELGFLSPLHFACVGTVAAVFLWMLYRAAKSVGISGFPKNSWDFLALFCGRVSHEPHLKRFKAVRHNDRYLAHVEAFRTPDGDRLCRDPCPLVACMFVGYLSMVTVGGVTSN